MQYAILCYHDENVTCAWSKEHDDAVMEKLGVVAEKLARQGKLGPVARLLPTTAATTLRKDREPPLVLVDKAIRHQQPGPYLVQAAIAAVHARAARADETDWAQIDLLYGTLERMQPSPVVSLNRTVAVSKSRGAEAALAMIEPLADKLGSYFYFHGARGAFLLQLGRADEARAAFNRAIALANTPAEAAHIRMQIDRFCSGHVSVKADG
jgi:RNA polymerase sigma-70 factor (ECF subfamily)